SSGHCFLVDVELMSSVRDNLFFDGLDDVAADEQDGVDEEAATRLDGIVEEQLAELVGERRLVVEDAAGGRRYYLPELYWTEQRLAKNVRELLDTRPTVDVVPPPRPTSGDFIPNDGQW